MTYNRSVATRASLLARRYRPSVCYTSHVDDRRKQSDDVNFSGPLINTVLQPRFFGGIPNASLGFRSYFQDKRYFDYSLSPTTGSAFYRYISTNIGDGSERNEYISDVESVLSDTIPGVLPDNAVDGTLGASVDATAGATVDVGSSQVPVMSEIAVSVADSSAPIAALQHLINYVHCFTGFNWWASIAITTILIRSATVPLLINLLKTTSKFTIMAPRLAAVKVEFEKVKYDPEASIALKKKLAGIYNEYGVSPLSPFKGLLIQGPLFFSFYLALTTMIKKIPSFKEGGVFWFTDLSTPDATFGLPILSGLTFLMIIELTMDTGMEGNPNAVLMKKVMRFFAVGIVFLTRLCPKALFCYWISSNIFTVVYGLIMKRVAVRDYLGVPTIPNPVPVGALATPKPAEPNYPWLASKDTQDNSKARNPS